jgi:ubiquinone/menaquinone biosynthesis C-methylase UbiE
MNYYDPFARYYDADFGDHTDDLLFYREMARRTGDPILELMCGTGRVLLPMAEEGLTLTGVDNSPAMLACARAKLEAAEVNHQVTLVPGDVRTVELPTHHFTMAFVAINSFMHLERIKDQFATLSTAHQALAPDGLLILDLFNPDPLRLANEDNRLILERSYELDGRQVHKFVATESDLATQMSRVSYLYDETAGDGQMTRRTMQFTMRWFYRYELEHLLARAGFMLRAVYGSYDLDDYTSESPRLIAVASPTSR